MKRQLALLWRIWDILEGMGEKELMEVLLWLRGREK